MADGEQKSISSNQYEGVIFVVFRDDVGSNKYNIQGMNKSFVVK